VSPEPRATYRLQLHAGVDLDAATALVPYLAALGVSHLYASPLLEAAPRSTHGYDVVNPARADPALGGDAAFVRLTDALRAHGLGLLLDVVPNHMAIAPENPWWWDVLENGPSSRWAAYFDVEWDPPEARLRNRVLLPVLGDHVGRELDAGTLRLAREGADFAVRYHAHRFPVAPRSLDDLLAAAAARSGSEQLAFLADGYRALPLATVTDAAQVARRHRDKVVLRGLLARLLAEAPAVAAAVDAEVDAVNGDADRLDALLERQNYRLAHWRAADRDLGYRRFFDIATLVALRIEDPRVFADVHERVLHWVAEGRIQGLRVDHPDGLRDPEGYCRRLRQAAPGAWIVVEKILEPGEPLRATWPVDGTTGYDFAARATGLLVDPAGEAPLTRLYAELTGEPTDWPALVREKKLLVLRELLASDVARLAALFLDVCERHPRHRDHTRHALTEALRELLASVPVYRTYVDADAGRIASEDVRLVEEAVASARAARPDLDGSLLDFLRDILLLRVRGPLETELVMRFQQLTGPATAKGVEDTAGYCFARFVALNEVGADPGRFGTSPGAFHEAAAATQRRWPRTLDAATTHDTKRSADVRARLALLSEIPERWATAVRAWREQNARHRADGAPDANAEYLYYQTLVGAWPLSAERAVAYMEKATREAKQHTSWTRPDPAYDAAVRGFVEATLADAAFTRAVDGFVAPLVAPGRVNALALALLACAAPGVPDLYQGTELWALSLVDPDNRRPVDWDARRAALAALDGLHDPADVLARADAGLPKLLVVRRALALRARRPAWFGVDAPYRPLAAAGARAAHVVAFARAEHVVAVVPRLVLGLGGTADGLSLAGRFRDTTLPLPAGRWRNVLTDEPVAGADVPLDAQLARFPVALLAREDDA
jgi:(1->4)-alpha-D-glucan 1-alpha-D-glucosylmutase